MEELLNAIGDIKKVDKALVSYIKLHTTAEIIEALKIQGLLSWTSLFDECPSYKYCVYDIYLPSDVANMIMDFQGYDIVYTCGSFDSDYGSDPSLELGVFGLRTDEHFMDTIHKIRRL